MNGFLFNTLKLTFVFLCLLQTNTVEVFQQQLLSTFSWHNLDV